ncbi:MAG TPA: hypothetical protein PKE55_09835, partial [Kiritimatiellia bacterium]|nr:hypothetical protein [Kiritimatiellia bacterium]
HGAGRRIVLDPGRGNLKLPIRWGVAGFPDVAGGGGNYLDASERALRLAKVRGGDVSMRFDMSMLRRDAEQPADVL